MLQKSQNLRKYPCDSFQEEGSQIFPLDLNLHCGFDLEDSNPKLSHNTPARDDVQYAKFG